MSNPLDITFEVGGPEKIGMDKFAEKYLSIKGNKRKVIADPHPLYFCTELNDHSLTP